MPAGVPSPFLSWQNRPKSLNARSAAPWKVLAGAWLAGPTVVAVLGALVAAARDCDDGTVWTLVLLAGAGVGLAGWWARRCRAPAWFMAWTALGGGLAGGAAGTFSWFIVSFDRCFTF